VGRVWGLEKGDRSTFAVRLSFLDDPDRGLHQDPDEALSWGSIEVWVDGRNLCANADHGSVQPSVNWYLLPLLEWIVQYWNPLLHEERLRPRNVGFTAAESFERLASRGFEEVATADEEDARFEWWERHALRSSRAGGLFPNIFLRRLRDHIEVSWLDEPVEGQASDFALLAGEGAALVKPAVIAEPLYEVVLAAVRQLVEWAPESARLSELVDRTRALAESPTEEERLGWLAGLKLGSSDEGGSRQLAADGWKRLSSLVRSVGGAAEKALTYSSSSLVVDGSCDAALLFGAVSPSIDNSDATRLAQLLVGLYSDDVVAHGLLAHSRETEVDHSTPWVQGQDLALEALDEFPSASDDWVDVRSTMAELAVSIVEIQLSDSSIRAVSIAGQRHTPTVALNERSDYGVTEESIRFALAHELCHLLHDWSEGVRLAIASGPWAPVALEKRANAFAAMFLMPPDVLHMARRSAGGSLETLDGVRAVAEILRVNPRALLWHAANIGFIDEPERDRLLDSL
jgi:Zn-dependent peptidase ImmA (M78 family)